MQRTTVPPTEKPAKPEPGRRTTRFRCPLIVEALFWGAVGYGVVRITPHLVAPLWGIPLVTDNHSPAMGLGIGLALGIFVCGNRLDGKAR